MAHVYEVSDFRNGLKIEMDGYPFSIVSFQHVKPGKGNAFTRTKMRNLVLGTLLERTFKSGEKFQAADLQSKEMQFLYKEGESFNFMDTTTYDTVTFQSDFMEDSKDLLIDGLTVEVLFVDGKAVTIELPSNVELEVTESAPGVKGDTATAATKEATLQTGLRIQVPLFVGPGDRIRVSTEDKKYVGRA